MKILENISLKNLTTFKIGGNAKYFAEVENIYELLEVSKFAKRSSLPIFIIGGGSDILISDKGFEGLVIKYTNSDIKFESQKDNSILVTAGAGMVWDDLVKQSVEKGLQGIECMSGIYGSVGAAPIQNIGAYGQELKDTFVSLNAFDIEKEKIVMFVKDQCDFSYRNSIFKTRDYWQKYVITDITLNLYTGRKPEVKYDSLHKFFDEKKVVDPSLQQVRDAVLEIRSGKFENPSEMGNAGSFFKNPILSKADFENLQTSFPDIPFVENSDGTIKTFAGWYIENAGLKGAKLANAQVSAKHALILLNSNGKATASEIKDLSEKVVNEVYKKYNIKLETEVQFIGI